MLHLCFPYYVVILFGAQPSIHLPSPYEDSLLYFPPSWGKHWFHVVLNSFFDWLKWGRDPTSGLCVSDRLRREERKKELCVSHSKVGVIEGQGGIQKNGSRAGELQVRQEGQLKTTCLALYRKWTALCCANGNEWNEMIEQTVRWNKHTSWKATFLDSHQNWEFKVILPFACLRS